MKRALAKKLMLTALVVVGIAAPATALVVGAGTPLGIQDTSGTHISSSATNALFNVSNAVPGDSVSACLAITPVGGKTDAIRLYGEHAGALSSSLNVKVEEGDGPDPGAGNSCSGFASQATVYNGPLADFPSTDAASLRTSGVAAGVQRIYRFTVGLPADVGNEAQSKSSTQSYVFNADLEEIPTGTGGGGGSGDGSGGGGDDSLCTRTLTITAQSGGCPAARFTVRTASNKGSMTLLAESGQAWLKTASFVMPKWSTMKVKKRKVLAKLVLVRDTGVRATTTLRYPRKPKTRMWIVKRKDGLQVKFSSRKNWKSPRIEVVGIPGAVVGVELQIAPKSVSMRVGRGKCKSAPWTVQMVARSGEQASLGQKQKVCGKKAAKR